MSSNCNFQWFFESLEVRKGKKKKQQKKTVKIDQQKRNQSQKKRKEKSTRTHTQITGDRQTEKGGQVEEHAVTLIRAIVLTLDVSGDRLVTCYVQIAHAAS